MNIPATFPAAANVDAVRAAMSKAGYPDPQVQSFGSSREVSIRLPPLGLKQDAQAIRAQVTEGAAGRGSGRAGAGAGCRRSAGRWRTAAQRRVWRWSSR